MGVPNDFLRLVLKKCWGYPVFEIMSVFFCEKFIKMWNGQIDCNSSKAKGPIISPWWTLRRSEDDRWWGVPISGSLGACLFEQFQQPTLSLSDLFGIVQWVIGFVQGNLKKELTAILQFRGGMQHRKRDLVQKVDEQSGKWDIWNISCPLFWVVKMQGCTLQLLSYLLLKEPIETLEGQSRWQNCPWKMKKIPFGCCKFCCCTRKLMKVTFEQFPELSGLVQKRKSSYTNLRESQSRCIHHPLVNVMQLSKSSSCFPKMFWFQHTLPPPRSLT